MSDLRRKSSVRRPSIGVDKLLNMTYSEMPKPGADFNLVYIGAGHINFGSNEGPWDHSFRIEHKLGPRLKVLGIIDPNRSATLGVLARKRASFVVSAYADTRVCSSLDEFVQGMAPGDRVDAFIIGSPPAFRGSCEGGKDVELQILKAFPNKHPAIFVEKPISTDTVDNAIAVGRAFIDSHTVVSVGYCLRYLRVVQQMRSIIEENDLHVMATVARYVCSYVHIAKSSWWMKSKDCGPIVEQATHMIDLSRYIAGDVVLDSVQAHSLEWYEEAGELSSIPVDENAIPEHDRIPRVTSATWKYETGAVGSLTHAVILKGTKYSTELEVYADGYQIRLLDPYNDPTLRVRHPENDDEEVHTFPNDDPYFNQMAAFIDAADGRNQASASAVADDDDLEILSTFDDSIKSYAFDSVQILGYSTCIGAIDEDEEKDGWISVVEVAVFTSIASNEEADLSMRWINREEVWDVLSTEYFVK